MKTLLIFLVLALSLSSIVHAQNWQQQQQYQQQQLYNQQEQNRIQQQQLDEQRRQNNQGNFYLPPLQPHRSDPVGDFMRGYNAVR